MKASPIHSLSIWKLLVALVACTIALYAISFVFGGGQSAFVSSEVRFADTSARGLAIVPASCPSYPHYDGECTTQDPVQGQCSISSSAWIITKGQSASLSWIGPSGSGTLGIPIAYQAGSISPGIGNVAQTGSATISPQATTVYRYTGTYTWGGGVYRGGFDCSATITVLPADYCPTGYALGPDGLCYATQCPAGQTLGTDGLCHAVSCPEGTVLGSDGLCHANNCPAPFLYCGTGANANNIYQRTYSGAPACAQLDNFYATCRYGCTNGSCNPASTTSDATITARPGLIARGNVAQIVWSSVGTTACTVTSSNGNSWTGVTGTQNSNPINAQTTFTLTCTARGTGASIVKTATVNVLPIFDEQ